MGQKAIVTTTDELEEMEEGQEQPEMEFELINETKEILGYTCKKAIMTDEDGNEVIYWYSEEIKVSSTGQQYARPEIPGFPMEFEVDQNGVIMSFLATTFSEKLTDDKDTLFDTSVPEGYETMTLEELKSIGL